MWRPLAAVMMPSRAGVSPVSIQLATCRQEICPCRWNRRERTVMRTPARSKFSSWCAPASGRPLARLVRLPCPSGVFPWVRKLSAPGRTWSAGRSRGRCSRLVSAVVQDHRRVPGRRARRRWSGESAWADRPRGAGRRLVAGRPGRVPGWCAGQEGPRPDGASPRQERVRKLGRAVWWRGDRAGLADGEALPAGPLPWLPAARRRRGWRSGWFRSRLGDAVARVSPGVACCPAGGRRTGSAGRDARSR